jgi:hypothetical protein
VVPKSSVAVERNLDFDFVSPEESTEQPYRISKPASRFLFGFFWLPLRLRFVALFFEGIGGSRASQSSELQMIPPRPTLVYRLRFTRPLLPRNPQTGTQLSSLVVSTRRLTGKSCLPQVGSSRSKDVSSWNPASILPKGDRHPFPIRTRPSSNICKRR